MAKDDNSPEAIRKLRELAITERDFLTFVRAASHLGYGRMMQIVEREYYRAATEENLCPPSGVLVCDTALGLMTPTKQREFISGYEADGLFRKH